MVAPSQAPSPRQAPDGTPAFTVYPPPDKFSGWLSLLGMGVLVLGLLAAVALLSPPGLSLSGAWLSGGRSAAHVPGQPTIPVWIPPTPSASASTSTALSPTVPCTARDTGEFRQNVTIAKNQHVCGNVVVFSGDMTIDGVVDGSVTLVGGTGAISGTVNGSLTAVDADINLKSGAYIGGNIQLVGGSIRRATNVSIRGSIEKGISPQRMVPSQWQGIGGSYDFPWSHLLFWILASIAVTALFPRHVALVRRAARESLPSAFFVGVVCSIVGAVLSVGLFVTCIGIPFALLVAIALVAASVVGTIALGLWLGERLLGRSGTARRASVFPALIGITIVALAQTAPCVGDIVTILTGCTGLGAAILAVLYARRRAVWAPEGLL